MSNFPMQHIINKITDAVETDRSVMVTTHDLVTNFINKDISNTQAAVHLKEVLAHFNAENQLDHVLFCAGVMVKHKNITTPTLLSIINQAVHSIKGKLEHNEALSKGVGSVSTSFSFSNHGDEVIKFELLNSDIQENSAAWLEIQIVAAIILDV